MSKNVIPNNSNPQANTSMSFRALLKQRLFWKVLLIFWLTTIATILANIYITKEIAFNEYKTQHLRLKMQNLASEAINLYEREGKKSLRRWYRVLARQEGIRVVLLYSNEKPVIKLSKHGRHHDDEDEHSEIRLNDHFLKLADQHVISADGESYILRILPSKYLRSRFNPEKLHGYRLLASFFIIALGSLWIAHSIARPIQILRMASEKISRGDLSVNVSKDIGTRRDELGKLATAFDTMAKKINHLLEEQKRLFADISHEIRTPLTRQKLALELLKSDPNNVKLQAKIEAQNSEIEHLISQLLNLLQVDNDHSFQSEAFELGTLLLEICEQSNLELEQKNLALREDIESKLILNADRNHLRRAIENILSNAIKYSPLNTTVSVQAHQELKRVVIKISDEGQGIPDEELTHILEPFYRTDKSRNSKTGGYGLGLAIANNIITKHNGSLSFTNLPNKGFQVTIMLPIDN